MPLTYMVSLAVMLLLMASVVHFVSLVTPTWVQLGIFVPVLMTKSTTTLGNAEHGEEDRGIPINGSTSMDVGGGGGDDGSKYVIGDSGPPNFVKVKLGLWEWCQELEAMSPGCQEPDFLGGVQVLALMVLLITPLSFVLLVYSVCCLTVLDIKKNRLVLLLSLLASVVSGFTIMMEVTIYAVLTRREVTRILTAIGENPDLPYLGWAFGAEALTGVLVFLAAFFIFMHFRRHAPKSSPPFQLVE